MGAICKHCTGQKCIDEPTEESPLQVECVSCGGYGCEACERGYVCYTSCPSRQVPQELISLVMEADLLKKGLAPDAGGLRDQDAKFVHMSYKYYSETKRFGDLDE